MGPIFKALLSSKLLGPILRPVLRPLFRVLMGLIAIPVFRFLLRKIFRVQELDEGLERDLEQWFKATLVLLAATKNMEMVLFGSLFGIATDASADWNNPWITGMRIMMAIGVIEMMPDQELFAIIHPGPPKLKYDREKGLWKCIREQLRPVIKGIACQHLNRASPVLAIMCTIFAGTAGWVCFGLAITQYLIIGLMTSRDKALDALSEFDRQVAIRRKQFQEEFGLEEEKEKKESQSPSEQEVFGPFPAEVPGELAKEMSSS
ncbi:MAG: DNA topoisomerase I [Planctomycetaceae bacterium]|nr:DNA topoisomerase I [Planctomycetaceae bacterium]